MHAKILFCNISNTSPKWFKVRPTNISQKLEYELDPRLVSHKKFKLVWLTYILGFALSHSDPLSLDSITKVFKG